MDTTYQMIGEKLANPFVSGAQVSTIFLPLRPSSLSQNKQRK